MNELTLYKTEITSQDGTSIRLVYDQEADILEILFGENEPATGVELTDQIVLRLNRNTRRPISLIVLDFSILAERTEYGPRSYPLNKLDDLPEPMQELVLQLVTTLPVSQFLKLSHFQVSSTERVPLTYVEAQPVMLA